MHSTLQLQKNYQNRRRIKHKLENSKLKNSKTFKNIYGLQIKFIYILLKKKLDIVVRNERMDEVLESMFEIFTLLHCTRCDIDV